MGTQEKPLGLRRQQKNAHPARANFSRLAGKMEDWEIKLAEAFALMESSRERVAAQRARIERMQALGSSTELAESLLRIFEEALVRRRVRWDELQAIVVVPKEFCPDGSKWASASVKLLYATAQGQLSSVRLDLDQRRMKSE